MADKGGLAELYAIMADHGAAERDRLNSAVSASRVEPLTLPGEQAPPAVTWLRKLLDDRDSPTGHRRESASALAYYERRAKKMELQYSVADVSERREAWRKLINSGIRYALHKAGKWPPPPHLLLGPADDFTMPSTDPEMTLRALLLPGNRQARRRQRAIDERVAGVWSGDEAERRELLRHLAHAVHTRLAEFAT